MLGHELARCLSRDVEVHVSIRRPAEVWPSTLTNIKVEGGVELTRDGAIDRILDLVRPEIVVNCVGAIKQKNLNDDLVWQVNANIPHKIALACHKNEVRLIQFSTDCVFSGAADPVRAHGYSEGHVPDPVDTYGRSKLAGEVRGPGSITLRTSFVGREISGQVSLVEWLLMQRGNSIRGYQHALFTGLSTTTVADVVRCLIQTRADLDGVWHVGGGPISKHDLLRLLIDRGRLNMLVEPDSDFHCDRRLDASRFHAATDWRAPGWEEMVDQVPDATSPSIGAGRRNSMTFLCYEARLLHCKEIETSHRLTGKIASGKECHYQYLLL